MEGASFGANYEWRRKAPEFVEKRAWQQWVQLAYEQHHYFPFVLEEEFMQRQDVNMTFVQTDQVPVTFLCSWGGGSIADFLKPIKWPKRGSIAWINSNCGGGGAHARTNYVRELMKHIEVDALGPCLHNKDLPPEYTAHPFYGPQQFGGAMKFKHDVFADYKIVLAFENNNVTDYVTEKIWNVFIGGALPVYMGAPNIDEWLPGEHSIIKVADYASPAELAAYLKKVLADDDLYRSYFSWKAAGLSERFKTRYERCVFYTGECRLCRHLHKVRDALPAEAQRLAREARVAGPGRDWYSWENNDGSAYVRVRESRDFHNLTGDFSLLAWVWPTGFSDYRVIDKNMAGHATGFSLDVIAMASGNYMRVCACGEYFTGFRRMALYEWYHLAAVVSYSSGTVSLYVDGRLDSRFTCSRPTGTNALDLHVGRAAGTDTSVWRGRLDDVMVWGRALSPDELFRVRFTRPLGSAPGLLLAYHFLTPDPAVAYDSSARGNHGTIVGKPTWIETREKPMRFASC